MGAWVQLLHGRGGGGGGPLLQGASPAGASPTTRTVFTRRTVAVRNSGGHIGGPAPPAGTAQAAGASSPSVNGSSPPPSVQSQEKTRKKRPAAIQKQQERRLPPSVLEVQRAIGVAPGEDGGGLTRGDGGNRSDSVLDFFASTPIGQAESPAERKLREAAEWLVERTESRGLMGIFLHTPLQIRLFSFNSLLSMMAGWTSKAVSNKVLSPPCPQIASAYVQFHLASNSKEITGL